MDNPYDDVEREAMNSHKTVDEILESKKVIMCEIIPVDKVLSQAVKSFNKGMKKYD